MKKWVLLLLALLLTLPGSAWMEGVDDKAVTVSLEENPTTGYVWRYALSEEGVLREVSDEYQPGGNAKELVGAGGIHTWIFEGASEGDVAVDFAYARSWEAEEMPARMVRLMYRVDADGFVTLRSSADVFDGEAIMAFPENPTTGYEWRYVLSQEGILTESSSEYAQEASAAGRVGTGGTHTWRFDAAAQGEVSVTFAYARPWEAEGDAIDAVVYAFRVDADGNITLEPDGSAA